jgi:hypothetical protein
MPASLAVAVASMSTPSSMAWERLYAWIKRSVKEFSFE